MVVHHIRDCLRQADLSGAVALWCDEAHNITRCMSLAWGVAFVFALQANTLMWGECPLNVAGLQATGTVKRD